MFAMMANFYAKNEVSTLQLRQINTLHFLTSDRKYKFYLQTYFLKIPGPVLPLSYMLTKDVIDLKQSLSLWNFANRFMSFLLLMKE
jgi:hypothetical protein